MREIVGVERDALILRVMQDIEIAGEHADEGRWNRAWQEREESFAFNPTDAALVPSFIRPGQPVRLNQRFVMPSEDYELHYVRWLQNTFLSQALKECASVAEFGCGTGHNLVALARQRPERNYIGYDFAEPACRLVRKAAEVWDLPIGAHRFDMLAPDGEIGAEGVFTFGAIEQLGDRFQPFIDWLIAQKPKVVVHIEPIPEMLDTGNLVDWLSLRFHAARGYAVGVLPYLAERVEVVSAERSYFGSLMLESYARIVWRPR